MTPIPGPRLPAYPSPGRRRRRRWMIRGTLLLSTLLLIAFIGPAGLRAYARLFRVDDPAPADAIVLLHGGIVDRPTTVAQLYKQGYAPRILMGYTTNLGKTTINESRDASRMLVEQGVPASAITILPPPVVTSTFMEAQAVRKYAETHPMKRIILVTTSFHTHRTRWVFRKVLAGTGIDIRAAASRHPLFDESDWYKSDEGLVTYVEETLKTLYYWVAY